MDTRKRVLQANLNNQGGAFSVAYEAQKELQDEYIFDYFFPDGFVKNGVIQQSKKTILRILFHIQIMFLEQ